jgi:hypothetical protein
MRWRSISALSLVLLGLLLAAPLSVGDKGLWLSLHGASETLLRASTGMATPEHSTLLPDGSSRVHVTTRLDRSDPPRSLSAPATDWLLGPSERRSSVHTTPTPAPHPVLAARPAPRAPPA